MDSERRSASGPRAGSVLIVDDHELLAHSLAAVLGLEGLAVELAELADGADVIAQAAALRPAVVLLDLDLGGTHAGGELLVRELVALGAAVVVVSGSSDVLRLGGCLLDGAVGVLAKSRSFDDLLAAVRAAGQGLPVMREADRQQLLLTTQRLRAEQRTRLAPFALLTPREAQVLEQVMAGGSAETIARAFVVSEATVRTQIRGILGKLGVSSQLAAVAEAHRVGWRPPGLEEPRPSRR